MTTFRNLSLAGVLGLGLLAGGCSAFDNKDEEHSSRSSDRYDDTRTSRSAGDVERASGAARGLPRDARVVEEVRGGRLSYIARDSGTVYLYDTTAGVVVWSGRIRDGDRVSVSPDRNRIEINGKEQADIDLKSNHRFELYSTDIAPSRRY